MSEKQTQIGSSIIPTLDWFTFLGTLFWTNQSNIAHRVAKSVSVRCDDTGCLYCNLLCARRLVDVLEEGEHEHGS